MALERQPPEMYPTLPMPHSPSPAGGPPALRASAQTGRDAGATSPTPAVETTALQAPAPVVRPIPAGRSVPQHPPRRPAPPAGRFGFLRSLRWRLALGFVAFLVVAMVLLAIFLVATVRPYLRGENLTNVEV